MQGLLLFGDTERSAALRHEIPLAIIDPLLFAEVDGRRVVLTSLLERDRVARVLPDAELLDFGEFGWKELLDGGMSFADRLRADGIALTVDEDVIALRRRAKSVAELDGIRTAQRAAHAGMAAAHGLLTRARPTDDGHLEVNGERLLAEDVRAALRAACTEEGAPCPPDVLVGSVWSGGGHEPGSGPLPSGLPIVVDLWPLHQESGCWADMTRTFVVGTPTAEHADLIAGHARVSLSVLERARAAIRPGITGRELFDLACGVFESEGHLTQRTAQNADEVEGFQFSLGHGVGLEVHEAPNLGLAGRDALVAGDVLAIEPGLWDPRIGEVRFEDLVLVTEDGCETLTRFPYDIAAST